MIDRFYIKEHELNDKNNEDQTMLNAQIIRHKKSSQELLCKSVRQLGLQNFNPKVTCMHNINSLGN